MTQTKNGQFDHLLCVFPLTEKNRAFQDSPLVPCRGEERLKSDRRQLQFLQRCSHIISVEQETHKSQKTQHLENDKGRCFLLCSVSTTSRNF